MPRVTTIMIYLIFVIGLFLALQDACALGVQTTRLHINKVHGPVVNKSQPAQIKNDQIFLKKLLSPRQNKKLKISTDLNDLV